MNPTQTHATLVAAQAEGLLPPDASATPPEGRPWPVVLLTALGAWLAAVPLLIVVALLLGEHFRDSSSAGVMGLLLTALAVVMLRSKTVPLFVEQLAIPGLITGIGLISWMFADHLDDAQATAALICPVLLVLSVALPQTWLRALLGAGAATVGGFALIGRFAWESHAASLSPWQALHLLLAAVLALAIARLRHPPAATAAPSAAWAEAVGSGWLLATLAGLAWWAGMTFLAGASLSPHAAQELAGEAQDLHNSDLQRGLSNAVSAGLAALGGTWLWVRWPAMRQAWCGGVVLVLAALAAMMPTLGACLLVLALCVGTRRWRLAATAALAAVWILGAFYYALSWPLASKAVALVMAAVVLAGLAVWGARSSGAQAAVGSPEVPAIPDKRRMPWAIALSMGLILVAANFSIWQKEHLIRHGQAVFVPLAPTDPRSLMQGDYMTLNFLPRFEANLPELNMSQEAFDFEHPRVVFTRDAQGILSLKGPDQGAALGPNEVAIQLVPKAGRWILVTDAFYFKEGEADRWSAARFGEFRVDDQGKALLVGLRGADLKPL